MRLSAYAVGFALSPGGDTGFALASAMRSPCGFAHTPSLPRYVLAMRLRAYARLSSGWRFAESKRTADDGASPSERANDRLEIQA